MFEINAKFVRIFVRTLCQPCLVVAKFYKNATSEIKERKTVDVYKAVFSKTIVKSAKQEESLTLKYV